MRSSVLPLALLVLTSPALADQQAWVSRSDADRAAALVPVGSTVRFFCAPCGDETWNEAEVVKVDVAYTGSEGSWEVQVNGSGVDLAYTYVLRDGRWENLALLLGLEAFEVPRFVGGASAEPSAELAAATTQLEHLEAALAGSAAKAARQVERARKAWQRYADAQVEAEEAIAGSPDTAVAARLRLTRLRIAEVEALLTLDP